MREVPLDLRSGALRSVLPFDTPFLLTGDPPDGVLGIEGVWCDVTNAPDKKTLASLVNERGELEECPIGQPPAGTSKDPLPIKGWSGDPEGDPANRKFYLFVPQRLEADHTFLFQFTLEREIQEADLAQFQAKAASALDEEFRDLPAGSLSRSGWQPVEERIRSILAHQPRRPNEKIVGTPGSLFGPRREFPDDPPWIEEFQAAFNTQLNRQNVLDGVNAKGTGALFSQLLALRNDPALEHLDASVRNLTVEQRSGIDVVLTAKVIEALKNLTSDDAFLADVAMAAVPLAGEPAAESSDLTTTPLSARWKAKEIDPYLDHAGKTVEALESLQSFVGVAPQLAPLQQPLGDFTEGSIAGLKAEIRTALGPARTVQANLGRLQSLLSRRTAAIAEVAGYIRRTAESQVQVVASSRGGFTTRAQNHISLDLGLLYAGKIGEVLPYAGANFYTRPVNRNVPLSEVGGFRRRFSLMMGITTSSLQETADGGRVLRDDLVANGGLVLGAGYRLSDTARISGGILVFEENSPNPLIDDLEIATEGFVAISFDVAIRDLLGNLGAAFGG